MTKLSSLLLSVCLLGGTKVIAAEPNNEPQMSHLTQQQRQEYQQQINQATSDQQRSEISARYRELSRNQNTDTAQPGVACGNRGSGEGGQPGNPCIDGKSGAKKKGGGAGVPAGDKNRPQKSGG